MSDGVTQKEFYEVVRKITEELHQATNAMIETKTIIRDYNGLRQKFNETDDRLQSLEDANKYRQSCKQHIGWVIGCIGGVFGIVSTAIVIYMQLK